MPYVRVVCTLKDKGTLIQPEAVKDFIQKQMKQKKAETKDWYVSAFTYDDDALEHWKTHGNSIAGYQGRAWANHLFWDLDRKGDLEKVRQETVKLANYLADRGYDEGLHVYFSGNKGFHVFLDTQQPIDRTQVSTIASKIAKAAGITIDTAVYNTTRVLRYPNTLHQESDLYKIPLTPSDLLEPIEHIIELAQCSRKWSEIEKPQPVDAAELLAIADVPVVVEDEVDTVEDTLRDFSDITKTQTHQRRCIAALENGEFGPGKRDEALMRLAAYYKVILNLSEDEAYVRMTTALKQRAEKFPEATPYRDEDTIHKIKQVYGPGWKNHSYSCKTDPFLASFCEKDGNACYHEMPALKTLGKNVIQAGNLFESYVKFGDDAAADYPKFGLNWLDERLRVRYKNYSIVAGASGSGKTSLIIQMMDVLNEQKIPHLMLSLDMSDTSLFEKLAARHTNYSTTQIEQAFNKNSRSKEKMREIGKRLQEKLPYTYFDFTSTVDMRYIERTIKSLNEDLGDQKIKVVFVDYAGRIIGGGDTAYANATANALLANDIAKNTETHIMFIAQVSRENGDHTSPIRTSRAAKESGAWEENATFVLTVWRPLGSGNHGPDNVYAVYIGKNRSGELGENHFSWEGKTGSIREMEIDEWATYLATCEREDLDKPSCRGPLGVVGDAHEVSHSRIVESVSNHDLETEIRKQGKSNGYASDDHEEELPASTPKRSSKSSFRPRTKA